MAYDFTDMAIRSMVMSEHQPTEMGLHKVKYIGVIPTYEFGSQPCCKTCREPWPCAPALAVREYEQEQIRAHHTKLAEGGYDSGIPPW